MRKLLYILIIFIVPMFSFARKNGKDIPHDSAIVQTEILLDSIQIGNDSIVLDSIERPEEIYEEKVFAPTTSTLHIPININIPLLEAKINEHFKGLIYEDNDIEDDSLMVKAWKERDFKITYVNNVLNYEIPVKIWIKKRFSLGFTHTDQEIEGSVHLKFSTAIDFSKNWTIITHTQFSGYEWINEPVLKFGVITITIRRIVDVLIKNNKNFIQNTIDKTIRETIPLNDYITSIWEKIQDPIPISYSNMNAWIKATPQALYTTPILGNYGNISTTVGVKCLMEVFMGNPPHNLAKQTQMPQLKMYTKTDENFNINILADIPYEVIDTIAKSSLLGDTLEAGKKSVVIDSLDIYGQNEKIVIGVGVKGFINGMVYLHGIPYYDTSTSSIRIKEVEYELETKNIFANLANLFYKRGLTRIIEEKLVIPIDEYLNLAKEMGSTELFDMELMENVRMNGLLNQLNVTEIAPTIKGLKIRLFLSGKIKIRVE